MKILHEKNWNSFDEYITQIQSIKVITINQDEWTHSICNCAVWMKDYICKHVIGISAILNLCQFPDIDYDIPISNNRKRGRPKLTSYALSRQPIEVHQTISHSNVSDEEHTNDRVEQIQVQAQAQTSNPAPIIPMQESASPKGKPGRKRKNETASAPTLVPTRSSKRNKKN